MSNEQIKTLHDQQIVAMMQLTKQWREEALAAGLVQITLAMQEAEQQAMKEFIIKHAAEKAYISSLATRYKPPTRTRTPLKLVPPSDLGEIG